MRQLPIYTGMIMLFLELIIVLGYLVVQSNIPSDTFYFFIVVTMLVLTNIAAVTMIVFGVLNEE